MVTFEQLSALGKAIMSAAVECELLGLYTVHPFLGSAFEQIVVEARALERREEEEDAAGLLVEKEEVLVGS